MNTMQLEGFLAEIEIDEEADLLRGTVVNAHEVLKFEGTTVGNLQAAFKDEIKAYRDQCRSNGNNLAEPARPVSKEMHGRMLRSARLVGRLRPGDAPDYWTLQEAYDELLVGLSLAHRQFVSTDDNGIEGAKLACQKMAWFIKCRWESPELASPFTNINMAFADVQMDRKPQLFYPKHKAEKRPRTSLARHLTRFIAALHEVDVLLGTKTKDSETKVAQQVAKWPALKAVTVTSDTVRNWRSRERVGSKEEKIPFQKIVDSILGEGQPKKKLADFLKNGPPGVPKPTKD